MYTNNLFEKIYKPFDLCFSDIKYAVNISTCTTQNDSSIFLFSNWF